MEKEGYYSNTQLEDEIKDYGYDSFEQFFADNPGAEEAVFDFIDQNLARVQKQELKSPAKHGLKRKIKKAFLQELVRDMIQVTEKKKGVDGKACWKGYRYAGTKNGKDVCIKVKGVKETANPQDGKAAPHGSGYKKVTK